MKKLITILTILLISGKCFSQQLDTIKTTPGNYLIKSGNEKIAAKIFYIGSAGIGLVGAISNAQSKQTILGGGTVVKADHSVGNSLFIMSAIAGLVGLILDFDADVQLKKAGQLMNTRKIGVVQNQNGVGFVYHLN